MRPEKGSTVGTVTQQAKVLARICTSYTVSRPCVGTSFPASVTSFTNRSSQPPQTHPYTSLCSCQTARRLPPTLLPLSRPAPPPFWPPSMQHPDLLPPFNPPTCLQADKAASAAGGKALELLDEHAVVGTHKHQRHLHRYAAARRRAPRARCQIRLKLICLLVEHLWAKGGDVAFAWVGAGVERRQVGLGSSTCSLSACA
eukprot:290272-Chlamydomonas_euryale.AAC.4